MIIPPLFAYRKVPSMAKSFAIEQTFRLQIFPASFILLKKSYGDHWWMRLRCDTIRVEESAF